MGRILGFDYGRRRIGVSVSDPLGLTAQPLDTWKGLSRDEVMRRIETLKTQMGVEKVVVGLPLTLGGKKGRMAKEVEQFASQIETQIQIPVTLWDERLTTVQAHRIIHQADEKPSKNKDKVDRLAAVLLLQNYLDHQKGAIADRLEEGD